MFFRAGVAKLVYALDSKSSGLNAHVGSTPTLGTISFFFFEKIAGFIQNLCGIIIDTGGDNMKYNQTKVVLV